MYLLLTDSKKREPRLSVYRADAEGNILSLLS